MILILDVLSEGKCPEHLLGLLLCTEPATPGLSLLRDASFRTAGERKRTAAVFSLRVLKDGHHLPQNGV